MTDNLRHQNATAVAMQTETFYSKHSIHASLFLSVVSALLLLATHASGFALLGPYTDWMMQTNGYRQRWDIGGPMDINEGYRWNVPVVTYAFDKGFLDYFGLKGVAAVESAIQILNELPPASKLVVTNYPFYSMGGFRGGWPRTP